MIASTRFFCAKIFLIFCFTHLSAGSIAELSFSPGENLEISSSILFSKEVFSKGVSTKSQCLQEANFDVIFDEEASGSVVKFPLHLSIILNKVNFSQLKDGHKIRSSPEDLATLEKSEITSLINRPLHFILKERFQPFELEEEQRKLFGRYQLFSSEFFKGVIEEDIHEILLFAGLPLQEGETFKFPQKIGSFDVLLEYTIKEVTAECVKATLVGQLQRKKLNLALPTEKDSAVCSMYSVIASGQIEGELFWGRKGDFYFTSMQKGSFSYSFKIRDEISSGRIEYDKSIIAKPRGLRHE
ncbi:hypothetical protein PHSC3_000575 [Chlamydiales bacterium STE3]|nr:hypothetical protein PHSC3_000575 [Chlamydiales bacterium STE3]